MAFETLVWSNTLLLLLLNMNSRTFCIHAYCGTDTKPFFVMIIEKWKNKDGLDNVFCPHAGSTY